MNTKKNANESPTSNSNVSILPNGPYAIALKNAKDEFVRAAEGKRLSWQNESIFALQALVNNDTLRKIAEKDPLSLQLAMVNVAAIGLTLNPAMGLCYLVPRDHKVILDISYRGLIRIATDTGSILGAKAELVYSKDEFEYKGSFASPHHKFDPFSKDRGELRGAYCEARCQSELVMVETMSMDEIEKARNMSRAYQYAVEHEKSCAYNHWGGEMYKKIVIKRAQKTWPKTDVRLNQAIHYLNEVAGEGLVIEGETVSKTSSTTYVNAPTKPAVIEPTPEDQVPVFARTLVDQLIIRAREVNAWQGAHDYAAQRLSLGDLAWARLKLNEAEKEHPQPADANENTATGDDSVPQN